MRAGRLYTPHPPADLPLLDGDYCWADGKSVSVYDSTVVVVTADSGDWGVGEAGPSRSCGPIDVVQTHGLGLIYVVHG